MNLNTLDNARQKMHVKRITVTAHCIPAAKGTLFLALHGPDVSWRRKLLRIHADWKTAHAFAPRGRPHYFPSATSSTKSPKWEPELDAIWQEHILRWSGLQGACQASTGRHNSLSKQRFGELVRGVDRQYGTPVLVFVVAALDVQHMEEAELALGADIRVPSSSAIVGFPDTGLCIYSQCGRHVFLDFQQVQASSWRLGSKLHHLPQSANRVNSTLNFTTPWCLVVEALHEANIAHLSLNRNVIFVQVCQLGEGLLPHPFVCSLLSFSYCNIWFNYIAQVLITRSYTESRVHVQT